MNNLYLFQLINAPPGLSPVRLAVALALARWLIYLIPIAMATTWIRGNQDMRRDLLRAALAVGIALGLAQIVAFAWPQPRPFALHMGTQYLAHSTDPGLPSDHVVVFWSLALATLRTRRLALWGFPLLALGLLVGWSRVFLGVHFPLDVLAAFPVAWAASIAAGRLQRNLQPIEDRLLCLYDGLVNRLRRTLLPPSRG